MKPLSKILLGGLLLTGLQFSFSGCASEGYVSTDVYYGPHHRDPWFHDDPWMHRRRGWYRDEPRGGSHTDIYISPPRPPSPPRIRLP